MDWFLYDNDLRHERVKQKIFLFENAFMGICNVNSLLRNLKLFNRLILKK